MDFTECTDQLHERRGEILPSRRKFPRGMCNSGNLLHFCAQILEPDGQGPRGMPLANEEASGEFATAGFFITQRSY
jgi:hypothetical protein